MSNNIRRNIKMTIEYDGTNYHGWQEQKNAVSVSGVITESIKELTGENVNLIGASRTDTGVHAYGQVANFLTYSEIPPERFFAALNPILPSDIVIKESKEASEKFHAQYNSKGKKYRYIIYNARTPSAILRDRAAFVFYGLKITRMQDAAEYFLGKHDFSAFCASGATVKSFERTIKSLTVERRGEVFEIEVTGDGFLYNMVRIIAGTLIDVGRGAIPVEKIPEILHSKDRRKAGRTAPPQGLYLVEVYY